MKRIATNNGVSNAVLLVALAVGSAESALAQGGGGFGGFGGAPSEPKVSAPVDIEELRRNYPFRSLKKRLEYERQRQSTNVKPKLSDAAAARLKFLDAIRDRAEIRTESLQMLHSDQVEKFVKASGFGIGRGVPPLPSAHQLPPPKDPGRLKLSRILTSVEEDGPSIELGDEELAEPVPGNWSPSKEALLRLSEHAKDDFANGLTLGYVKSLDQVAGFEPHAFRRKPELYRWDRKTFDSIPHAWKVSRLELVSLLKQPDPRVYVSEYLPRMQELDEKVTRAVTPFETDALKQLRAGEEVHVEAKLNAIRMVGAIRASKKCIECHQVERGELLGAFTYELKRMPPFPVPKRRAI